MAKHTHTMWKKKSLEFDILSDPGNIYADLLGLRFKLPDYVKSIYLEFGIDLTVYNGDDSWTLPMPGRFVIDRNGIIRAVNVNPDYKNRPEPEKTVADISAL
jgi:peroxiredoxin